MLEISSDEGYVFPFPLMTERIIDFQWNPRIFILLTGRSYYDKKGGSRFGGSCTAKEDAGGINDEGFQRVCRLQKTKSNRNIKGVL